MQKGKLKYFSDLASWKVIDKKGNKYEPNPYYLDIYFKNYRCFEHVMIIYQDKYYQKKEAGWYVQFQDISFRLDKSQIYEIEFHYWEPTF